MALKNTLQNLHSKSVFRFEIENLFCPWRPLEVGSTFGKWARNCRTNDHNEKILAREERYNNKASNGTKQLTLRRIVCPEFAKKPFFNENKVLKYQFFHINPTINGNGLEIAGEKAVFNRESGNTSCREVYRILSPQNMVGDRLSTFFKWAKMVQKFFKV